MLFFNCFMNMLVSDHCSHTARQLLLLRAHFTDFPETLHLQKLQPMQLLLGMQF